MSVDCNPVWCNQHAEAPKRPPALLLFMIVPFPLNNTMFCCIHIFISSLLELNILVFFGKEYCDNVIIVNYFVYPPITR